MCAFPDEEASVLICIDFETYARAHDAFDRVRIMGHCPLRCRDTKVYWPVNRPASFLCELTCSTRETCFGAAIRVSRHHVSRRLSRSSKYVA